MSEVLSDREAVIFYAEQRGYASAMEAERKLHEARIEAQAAEIERLRGVMAKAVENTLDAASAYMTEQYGISALSHPVDRARAIATLAELTGAQKDGN